MYQMYYVLFKNPIKTLGTNESVEVQNYSTKKDRQYRFWNKLSLQEAEIQSHMKTRQDTGTIQS
jgi:hypothetical protein